MRAAEGVRFSISDFLHSPNPPPTLPKVDTLNKSPALAPAPLLSTRDDFTMPL